MSFHHHDKKFRKKWEIKENYRKLLVGIFISTTRTWCCTMFLHLILANHPLIFDIIVETLEKRAPSLMKNELGQCTHIPNTTFILFLHHSIEKSCKNETRLVRYFDNNQHLRKVSNIMNSSTSSQQQQTPIHRQERCDVKF